MSDVNSSIADEVEAAIAAGSAGKCTETVERVTALFLLSAGSYNPEQIERFGDVFDAWSTPSSCAPLPMSAHALRLPN